MKTTAVGPKCRYGHGQMAMETQDGAPVAYVPIAFAEINRRFAFLVYRCQVCGTVELRDAALPLDRRQSVVATEYARRATDMRKDGRIASDIGVAG